jgi:hypothetical protein
LSQLWFTSVTQEEAGKGKVIAEASIPTGCAYLRLSISKSFPASFIGLFNVNKDKITDAILNTGFSRTNTAWEVGSIRYNSAGDNINSTTRIRSKGYIDLSSRIAVSSSLQIAAYVYSRSGTFLGIWTGSDLIMDRVPWSTFIDIRKIYTTLASTAPNCLIRFIARYPTNEDISASAASDIVFYADASDKLYATIGVYDTWAVCGASYDAGSYQGHSNTYSVAWGRILSKRVGNTFTNYAFGGATTKTWISAQTEHSLTQALNDSAKELYVLTFGGNDASQSYPVGEINDISTHSDWHDYPATFIGYYGQIIDRLMDHASNAKFIMTTPSSPWYNTAQTNVDNAVRSIAQYYGIPLIVWESDPFMQSNLFIDHLPGLHPTPIGYSGMALAFERLFSKCVLEYPAYFTAIS